MSGRRPGWTAAILVLFATPALADHDVRVGPIRVDHPFAHATTADAAQAFMIVENAGAAPDRLLSASSPAAERVDLVDETGETAGAGLAVPPDGGELWLEPGGAHLRLVGLAAPLAEGDDLPLRLVFETAGPVDVAARVEALPPAE